MFSRHAKSKLYAAFTRMALGLCLGVLVFLLLAITVQGIKAFSLQFFLLPARDFGASGGILYQIIGSLLLVIVAALLVLPFAVGTAIYRSECVKSDRVKRALDLAIFCLNSIPSVTYGLFGLILFVNIFGTGISWFVGSIILPQSVHGIITGILIALARAIGETAPIMFIATAFSGVTVPKSLNEWGSSLTLIILVMLFSFLAYFARLKFKTLSQR